MFLSSSTHTHDHDPRTQAAHYVEDDDNMFRFDYPKAFLLWALTPPGFRRDWHVGVRVAKSGKLVGVITGVPCETRVYDKSFLGVEINFLWCVAAPWHCIARS